MHDVEIEAEGRPAEGRGVCVDGFAEGGEEGEHDVGFGLGEGAAVAECYVGGVVIWWCGGREL